MKDVPKLAEAYQKAVQFKSDVEECICDMQKHQEKYELMLSRCEKALLENCDDDVETRYADYLNVVLCCNHIRLKLNELRQNRRIAADLIEYQQVALLKVHPSEQDPSWSCPDELVLPKLVVPASVDA
jgi:hypothetical protein